MRVFAKWVPLDLRKVSLAFLLATPFVPTPAAFSCCGGETDVDSQCEPKTMSCDGDSIRFCTCDPSRTPFAGFPRPLCCTSDCTAEEGYYTWWSVPCAPDSPLPWTCVSTTSPTASRSVECREIGARRCSEPGTWGCEGSWITYCSADGYLSRVYDCAADGLNPLCVLVEDGDDPTKRRAICSYSGAGYCEVDYWGDSMCDGDYVVLCQRCPHRDGQVLSTAALASIAPDVLETSVYRYCWGDGDPGRLVRIEHCPNGCSEGQCRPTP